MPSLSDEMLGGGCLKHIGAVHGESILILSGPDAGKIFQANRLEIEPDSLISGDLEIDPRGKRIFRFDPSLPVPNILASAQVQRDDGSQWTAVRLPRNNYLTVDFELLEIAAKDQQ